MSLKHKYSDKAIERLIAKISVSLHNSNKESTKLWVEKDTLVMVKEFLITMRDETKRRKSITTNEEGAKTLQQVAEETIAQCMKGVGDISISYSVRADPKFPINMLRAIQRQVRRELNKLID